MPVKVLKKSEEIGVKDAVKYHHCRYALKSGEGGLEFDEHWKMEDFEVLIGAGFPSKMIKQITWLYACLDEDGFSRRCRFSFRSEGKHFDRHLRIMRLDLKGQAVGAVDGKVSGWAPVKDQGAFQHFDKTGIPADLWQVKLDDEELGEVYLEDCEVEKALQQFGNPLPPKLQVQAHRRITKLSGKRSKQLSQDGEGLVAKRKQEVSSFMETPCSEVSFDREHTDFSIHSSEIALDDTNSHDRLEPRSSVDEEIPAVQYKSVLPSLSPNDSASRTSQLVAFTQVLRMLSAFSAVVLHLDCQQECCSDKPKSKMQASKDAMKYKDSRPSLPLCLNSCLVTALGTIVSEPPEFHNECCLWPVGFKSVYVEPQTLLRYECEIQNGLDTILSKAIPAFTVTVRNAMDTRQVITSDSPAEVWEAVKQWQLANGTVAEKEAALRWDAQSMEGRFGLQEREVQRRLEGLSGSFKCSKYKFISMRARPRQKRALSSKVSGESETKKRCIELQEKLLGENHNVAMPQQEKSKEVAAGAVLDNLFQASASSLLWKQHANGPEVQDAMYFAPATITALVTPRSTSKAVEESWYVSAISQKLMFMKDGKEVLENTQIHADGSKIECQASLAFSGSCELGIFYAIAGQAPTLIGQAIQIRMFPPLKIFVLGDNGQTHGEIIEYGEYIALELRAESDDQNHSLLGGTIFASLMNCFGISHEIEGCAKADLCSDRIEVESIKLLDDAKGLCLFDSRNDFSLLVGKHTVSCFAGGKLLGLQASFKVVATPTCVEVRGRISIECAVESTDWSVEIVVKSAKNQPAACKKANGVFIDARNLDSSLPHQLEPIMVLASPVPDDPDRNTFKLTLQDPVPKSSRGVYTLLLHVEWEEGDEVKKTTLNCTNVKFKAVRSPDPRDWTSRDVVCFLREFTVVDASIEAFLDRDHRSAINGQKFVDIVKPNNGMSGIYLKSWLSWSDDDVIQRQSVIDEVSKQLETLITWANFLKGEFKGVAARCILLNELSISSGENGDQSCQTAFEFIGKGGQARVYKAYWGRKHKYVALKVPKEPEDLVQDSSIALSRTIKEIYSLYRFNGHPHVVRFFGIMIGTDDRELGSVGIVMEYADEKDLATLIQKIADEEIPDRSWVQWLDLARGAVRGLLFLHQSKFAHKDVKSHNILICGGKAKIGDLGMGQIIEQMTTSGITVKSKMSSKTENKAKETCGTYNFMAPEAIQAGICYDELAGDVWGYAAVLFHIITRQVPFKGLHDSQISSKLSDDKQSSLSTVLQLEDKIKQDCPPFLVSLCHQCGQIDPTNRPTFEVVDELLHSEQRKVWGFFAPDQSILSVDEEIEGSDRLDLSGEAMTLTMLLEIELFYSDLHFTAFPVTSFAAFDSAMERASERKVESLLLAGHCDENHCFAFCDSDSIETKDIQAVFEKHFKRGEKHVSCVVLNACQSFQLGITLFQTGVKFVVCWRDNVNDSKAKAFSHKFYKALGEKKAPLTAFKEAKHYVTSSFHLVNGTPALICDESIFELESEVSCSLDVVAEGCKRSWNGSGAGEKERSVLERLKGGKLCMEDGGQVAVGNGLDSKFRLTESALQILFGVKTYRELWAKGGFVVKAAEGVCDVDLKSILSDIKTAIELRKTVQENFASQPDDIALPNISKKEQKRVLRNQAIQRSHQEQIDALIECAGCLQLKLSAAETIEMECT